MGRRDLHILLISAKSLPKKGSSEMQVYAKAYLSYKPKLVQFTAEDPQGGVNPKWDDTFRFTLKSRKTSNEFLNIELCVRPPSGNQADPVLVGHVQIPLETFQNENKEATGRQKLSLNILEGGTIHFSYKLGKYNSRIKTVSKKIAYGVVGIAVESAIGYGIDEMMSGDGVEDVDEVEDEDVDEDEVEDEDVDEDEE